VTLQKGGRDLMVCPDLAGMERSGRFAIIFLFRSMIAKYKSAIHSSISEETMRNLKEFELESIAFGDRWGDGRDDLNHPDKSGVIYEECTPVAITGGLLEECVTIRWKKK
jgi:hypothetical protein